MNPEPIFSGECAVLALLAFILGVLLLGAVLGLCVHIKQAVLGRRLLTACGDSYEAAVKEIAGIEAQNKAFARAVLGDME
jgi:hypothetical protein